jgi:hypothetical protein
MPRAAGPRTNEPADHAISRALRFQLQPRPRPATRLVGGIWDLGDDAVDPTAREAVKPAAGGGGIVRGRRGHDGLRRAREQVDESRAALDQRPTAQVGVAVGQQVERHEHGRRLRSQSIDA